MNDAPIPELTLLIPAASARLRSIHRHARFLWSASVGVLPVSKTTGGSWFIDQLRRRQNRRVRFLRPRTPRGPDESVRRWWSATGPASGSVRSATPSTTRTRSHEAHLEKAPAG